MTTRYPSRQEIERQLKPQLDRIRAESVYADYDEPCSPAIVYREVVGEKGAPPPPSIHSQNHASPLATTHFLHDHHILLTRIQNHTGDGLKSHFTQLRIGIEKGNRLLGDLKKMGFIIIHQIPVTNRHGGRPRLVPVLTPKGRQFLESCQTQT